MPNPKGKPENLERIQPKGEEPLTANLSFRVSESMKEQVKAHDEPAEFCRRAIQEALDKEKKK